MKLLSMQSKKWAARVFLSIGAMLGFASCQRGVYNPKTVEGVYGPPPSYYENVKPVKVDNGSPAVKDVDGHSDKAIIIDTKE